MNRPLHILLLIALLTLTGCRKNEFDIEFSLGADVTRPYRVIYYASDARKGWFVETAVDVRDGKGKLKGITRNPTLLFFLGENGTPAAFLYAERGDNFKITGKTGNPAEWKIEGNGISERLSEWTQANKDKLRHNGTTDKAVAAYVREHPDDPVSALLLLVRYDRRANEKEFMKLFSSLKGKAAKPEWSALVSRADFLEGNPQNARAPKSLLLHTADGIDTVLLTGRPVMLVFKHNDYNSNREVLDILRQTARDWPDSSQRIIADIDFDTDSMARYRGVRYDSITGAIRAWLPLGFSDPIVRSLRVPSIPYARVSDAKGNIIYSGEDLQQAARKFSALH